MIYQIQDELQSLCLYAKIGGMGRKDRVAVIRKNGQKTKNIEIR